MRRRKRSATVPVHGGFTVHMAPMMLKILDPMFVRKLPMTTTVWNCEQMLGDASCALVVLNRPLNVLQCNLLSTLWPDAKLRIAVDGGANSLFKSLPDLTPDLITGDLDSIREDVRRRYEDRGTVIVRTIDQNLTDFTKCLKVIAERPQKIERVLAFCAAGGRFDQIMGNINTLHKSVNFLSQPVILHSGGEITWLLHRGKHKIVTQTRFVDMNCGLLPIGSPVVASSSGLKWELDSTKLAFSGLVSSSNRIASHEITIETDGPIIWTMSTGKDEG